MFLKLYFFLCKNLYFFVCVLLSQNNVWTSFEGEDKTKSGRDRGGKVYTGHCPHHQVLSPIIGDKVDGENENDDQGEGDADYDNDFDKLKQKCLDNVMMNNFFDVQLGGRNIIH